MDSELTPELLLRAYASGIFPMAESHDNPELFWVDPERRGILPLDEFHISRSLARRLRAQPFSIRINSDFAGVIDGCAARPSTWINEPIRSLCLKLHDQGHAHTIETWEDGELVGGVYGIVLGGAFFGESMFSRRRDASKIALAYLMHHLNACGFTLFDTQFLTPHLESLGAIEISRAEYLARLESALRLNVQFAVFDQPPSPSSVIQRSTQTS